MWIKKEESVKFNNVKIDTTYYYNAKNKEVRVYKIFYYK